MYYRFLTLWLLLLSGTRPLQAQRIPGISTIFVIVMENHDWSAIKDNSYCPYINSQLLPQAAYATAYFNPPGNHPSEPNYLWLVGGTNFGIKDDKLPAVNTRRTTNHLAARMDQAGVPWKAYVEDITGRDIPLTNNGVYAVRHVPFLFFENINTNLAYVTNHVRPFTELAGDLAANRVPNFCFITPNLTNDMHNTTPGSPSTRLQGDNWLAKVIPTITNAPAYQKGGLIILTWDEGAGSTNDGPIGLILLSPRIRSQGYTSTNAYDHSDTLRSIQDQLGATPYLGAAASATGLGEFFKHLRLETGETDGAGLHFTLRDALPGRTYRLEATDTVEPFSWNGVTDQVATNATVELPAPGIPPARRFYRARELP